MEDTDEPMDHQVIPKRFDENCLKVTDKFTMQFGSFLCELKQSDMNRGDVAGAATMTSKIINEGICAPIAPPSNIIFCWN